MKVFDGAKMRAIRKEAEFTQYDLAPMVGISQKNGVATTILVGRDFDTGGKECE